VKLALLLALPLFSQTSQFTDHTDNSRLATVTDETKLTPANVAALNKLTTLSLDGRVYTAPLYIPNLSVSGTLRNVIFAGSSNNSMYAWDADSFTQLWTTGALDTPCSTSCGGFKWGLNYDQTVGIFSAPVIDVANGWLFVVSHTNTPTYKLYKLNLTTGATISSTTLTASVSPSTASDSAAGVLTFNPDQSTQRAGLTLANGNVYVMFSSVRDVAPWHGWIMARKETDLSTIADYCTNWNQNGGGVWMSNSGASVDASGNLYVVTGNGGTDSGTWTSSYDGVTEFSMSILKLSSTLVLQDWYTPANYASQNAVDTDLGSSHPMLIPNPASPGNYLIVTGGKDYQVYSVQSQCMGHLGGTVGGCPGAQVFATGTDGGAHLGIYGDAYMNGIGYFPNTAGLLYAFTLQNTGQWNTTPVTGSTTAFPGAMLTGSINGTSNGVLWAITADASTLVAPSAGKLRALNASTLVEIWNSGSTLGNVSKFLSPTVANGRVYVPTYDSSVIVYGLNPATTLSGNAVMSGKTTIQ
jgi:outer membrane protein assembly factor BamB